MTTAKYEASIQYSSNRKPRHIQSLLAICHMLFADWPSPLAADRVVSVECGRRRMKLHQRPP